MKGFYGIFFYFLHIVLIVFILLTNQINLSLKKKLKLIKAIFDEMH